MIFPAHFLHNPSNWLHLAVSFYWVPACFLLVISMYDPWISVLIVLTSVWFIFSFLVSLSFTQNGENEYSGFVLSYFCGDCGAVIFFLDLFLLILINTLILYSFGALFIHLFVDRDWINR